MKNSAKLFGALSSEMRLVILELLSDHAELSVLELFDMCDGCNTQSNMSQHLRVLRKHGLVKTRRSNTNIYYSLSDVRVSRLIDEALQLTA